MLLRAVDGVKVAPGGRIQLVLLYEVQVRVVQAHVLGEIIVVEEVVLVVDVAASVLVVAVLALNLEHLVPRYEAAVLVEHLNKLCHSDLASVLLVQLHDGAVDLPPARL